MTVGSPTGEGIFISTPLSSVQTETLESLKAVCRRLKAGFSASAPGARFFCAAIDLNADNELDSPKDSAAKDFAQLEVATFFVLLYPDRVSSSALVELGYAVCRNIRIVVVVPDRSVLPFMAQRLDEVFGNVIFVLADPLSLDVDDHIVHSFHAFSRQVHASGCTD